MNPSLYINILQSIFFLLALEGFFLLDFLYLIEGKGENFKNVFQIIMNPYEGFRRDTLDSGTYTFQG